MVDKKISLSDFKEFGLRFWLISFSCMFTYVPSFSWNSFAEAFFSARFSFTSDQIGSLLSIPFFVAAGLCPFFGITIDKIGCRAIIMLISSFTMAVSHLVLMLLPDCYQCYSAMAPIILIGVSSALYGSAMWVSVAYVVPQRVVGTAYGAATSLQNAGLALGVTVVGYIIELTPNDKHGYYWASFFFMMVAIGGTIFNILLNIVDYRTGSVLNKPRKKENVKPVELPLSIEESDGASSSQERDKVENSMIISRHAFRSMAI